MHSGRYWLTWYSIPHMYNRDSSCSPNCHLKLHNCITPPLASKIPFTLRTSVQLFPSLAITLTSVVYAMYPIKAGKATMYAKVILAVRPVHLKYLCRLTIISVFHQYQLLVRPGEGSCGILLYLTNAGSIARARYRMSAHIPSIDSTGAPYSGCGPP
jgi:hypothetical protein